MSRGYDLRYLARRLDPLVSIIRPTLRGVVPLLPMVSCVLPAGWCGIKDIAVDVPSLSAIVGLLNPMKIAFGICVTRCTAVDVGLCTHLRAVVRVVLNFIGVRHRPRAYTVVVAETFGADGNRSR